MAAGAGSGSCGAGGLNCCARRAAAARRRGGAAAGWAGTGGGGTPRSRSERLGVEGVDAVVLRFVSDNPQCEDEACLL